MYIQAGPPPAGKAAMQELISVVVPVYQVEAYLDECVCSILEQTYRNLELILVDDGSPDRCGEMCDEWARRDARVRVIHQKNAGPGAARNAGIDGARGDYLCFVDSDDTVDPLFLETLHAAMTGAQMAVCGVNSEEEGSLQLVDQTVSIEQLQAAPSRYTAPVIVNSLFNKMYRTEMICQNGLRMDASMRRAEDLCFVARYLQWCSSIRMVPQELYRYRKNESSITHTFYHGIARDEIKGWHVQAALFLPDAALSAQERDFFSVWKYGKVQAIFRYILSCAPSLAAARDEIGQLLQDPLIRAVYTNEDVCRRLGRKKVVYAQLARLRWYAALTLLFRTFGVG